MAKEYIEREKAVELVKNYGKGAISDGLKTLDPVDDIVAIVKGFDLIPVADAVEVVRCENCKHSCNARLLYGEKIMTCKRKNIYNVKSNDYCSYGERKEK